MPKFDVVKFIQKHAVEIAEISRGLQDFEIPAQRTINRGFERMSVERFVGKDDRWEQVTAHQCGWDYVPPPARLIRRWRTY